MRELLLASLIVRVALPVLWLLLLWTVSLALWVLLSGLTLRCLSLHRLLLPGRLFAAFPFLPPPPVRTEKPEKHRKDRVCCDSCPKQHEPDTTELNEHTM